MKTFVRHCEQRAVGAGRDINLTAGVQTGSSYDETHYKKKGFMSSKTTHIKKAVDWEQSLATTFTGDTAVLMAGRDLNVSGSNVGAQKDLVMSAERDVNILPGQNAQDSYDYKMVKKSGFGAMGGMSYGSSKQTDSLDSKKVFHNASTVGSVEGDVLINAGNALNITGSNVIAPQGDITLIGKEVNICAALDTTQEREFHEIKQTGLSINASTPLVDAMQTAGRMGDAAGKTDNKVMQGLALATTGLAAVNAYDAVAADPKRAGGVSISINFGVSKSQSTTDRASSSVLGSTVAAGRDLTILAVGAGADSDVTVTGSRLSAGNNAVIKAEGDILLQAAQNFSEQHTKNKNYSGSIGIGVAANSDDGIGVMLNIGAGGGRGRADGKDTSWNYTDVTAGNVLALQSDGDTSLTGASGSADQIIASVGKNLRVETLQDTSTYDAKQQSAGIQASICIYGYCKSSVSGNVSQGRMDSNFKSATEQAGLKAGDGGFLVDVGANTTLIGAVISSSERAVADGLNRLNTGTLVVEDVKNTARYKADQVALSGGYSWGGNSGGEAKKGDVGTNSKGQAAGGSEKVPGSNLPTNENGMSAGMPVVAAASGNAHSTTHSAISGGSVIIRDDAGQIALTGKSAAETIASLNRDTSDTLNALKPIFDKEKIEAGFEIVAEASRQAGQFLTNRAREADAIRAQLGAELDKGEAADPDRLKFLNTEFARTKKWALGGDARNAVTVIVAAAAGNVTGSAGDFAVNAAVGYLQTQGAKVVKQWADSLPPGVQSESVRAALHGVLACGSAAAQGAGCSSAAAGAGLSSVLGYLLATSTDGSAEDIEAKNNLLNGLVASIVGGLGGQAAAASAAARIESENNSLYRNSASVAKATAEQRAALEQAWDEGKLTPAAYEQALRTLDVSSNKIDALLTIYNIQSGAAISEQLAQMSDVHVSMFAEAVGGLLTFPGMSMSAYELATGETAASKEEANYFFAALGVIPGSQLGKAVDKLGDLALVLKNEHAVAAAMQIARNQARGKTFEEAVLDYLSLDKNTRSFTANVNGKLVTVIPDAAHEADRILEIKNVARLSNSAQFRAYAKLVEEGGVVTKGMGTGNGAFKQFGGIDLIVPPGGRKLQSHCRR